MQSKPSIATLFKDSKNFFTPKCVGDSSFKLEKLTTPNGLTRTIGYYTQKDGKKAICVHNAGRNPIENQAGVGFDIFYNIEYCKQQCTKQVLPPVKTKSCPKCIKKGDNTKYFRTMKYVTKYKKQGYWTLADQGKADVQCQDKVTYQDFPCDVPTCDYFCVKAWTPWDNCACSSDCGYKQQIRKEYIKVPGSRGTPCPLLTQKKPCTIPNYGFLFISFDTDGGAKSDVFDEIMKSKKRTEIARTFQYQLRGSEWAYVNTSSVNFLDCDNPKADSWNQRGNPMQFKCTDTSSKICHHACIKAVRLTDGLESRDCYEACPPWDFNSDKGIKERSGNDDSDGFGVYYSVQGLYKMTKEWKCTETAPGRTAPLGGRCLRAYPPASWGNEPPFTGPGAPKWPAPGQPKDFRFPFDYFKCRRTCVLTTSTTSTTTTSTTSTTSTSTSTSTTTAPTLPCKGKFVWDTCEPCQNLVDSQNTLRCGYQYANFVQDFSDGFDKDRMDYMKILFSKSELESGKWVSYERCTYRMVSTPRQCAKPCQRNSRTLDYDFSTCQGKCTSGPLQCEQNKYGCVFHQEPVLCREGDASRLNCLPITLVDSPNSRHNANNVAIKLVNLQHHTLRYVDRSSAPKPAKNSICAPELYVFVFSGHAVKPKRLREHIQSGKVVDFLHHLTNLLTTTGATKVHLMSPLAHRSSPE